MTRAFQPAVPFSLDRRSFACDPAGRRVSENLRATAAANAGEQRAEREERGGGGLRDRPSYRQRERHSGIVGKGETVRSGYLIYVRKC